MMCIRSHCHADHVSTVICSKERHTQTGRQTDRLNVRLEWQTDRFDRGEKTLCTTIWRKKIAREYLLEDWNLCSHRGAAVWGCEVTWSEMEMIILMDWSSICKPLIHTQTRKGRFKYLKSLLQLLIWHQLTEGRRIIGNEFEDSENTSQ